MEYGFLAFENSPPASRQPIFVRTIRQVHHDTDTDVPLPARDETIDHGGILRRLRALAADPRPGRGHPVRRPALRRRRVLPADQSDGAGGDPSGATARTPPTRNVVVSGWQVYDNKGQVVEKYEPFFSTGWDYAQPGDAQIGQKVDDVLRPARARRPHREPRRLASSASSRRARHHRGARSDNPETFEPTPWETYTYDANDNAGRTHPAESAGYRHHWNTPASIVVDALGRTVDAVERNREMRANPGDPLPPIEKLHARIDLRHPRQHPDRHRRARAGRRSATSTTMPTAAADGQHRRRAADNSARRARRPSSSSATARAR